MNEDVSLSELFSGGTSQECASLAISRRPNVLLSVTPLRFEQKL